MAIHRNERRFQKIFSEIDINIVPVKFVKDVTCSLQNGNEIVLKAADLTNKTADDNLETVIRQLEFYDKLSELKIRINYELVEREVDEQVKILLNQTQ